MSYYGRTSDPGDYYTGGQDQNFDPMTGRLLGGQLFMQFMNQLQSLKDQERKRKWEIEDRDLNKRLIEARIKDYEEANRAVPQETPEEKHQREIDKLTKQHEFKLKEIEAGNKAKAAQAEKTATKKESDLEYKEKKSIYDQNKKDRAARLKEFKVTIPNRLNSIEREISSIKTKVQAALNKGDQVTPMLLKSRLDSLSGEQIALEKRRDEILSDVGIETEPKETPKTSLPTRQSYPKAPADKTKLIDGQVYEFPNGIVGKYDKKTNSVIPIR